MEKAGDSPIRGFVVCACLALVLASCGGGGSGGDGESPPPAGLQPLELQPHRVGTYFDTAFSFFSTARSLTEIGVAAYQTFAGRGSQPVSFGCLSGGSITISLEDEDDSGGLSAGDRVRIAYEACASPEDTLDAVLSVAFHAMDVQGGGPISVARARAAAAAASNSLVYDVTLESFSDVTTDGTFALSGSVAVTYTFSNAEDRFQIHARSLANSATFQGGSQVLTLRDAAYDYRLDNQLLRYELSMDGRLDIEAGETRGYFTFETGAALAGVFNNNAGSGSLTLRGAGDGYIRVEPDPTDASFSRLHFYYSDDGTSEREEEGSWGTIAAFPVIVPVRNGIDIPSSSNEYEPPQPLAGRRIDLGAPSFDMAVDAARSSIYVSVPARNEIVVVSSVHMNVVDRIRVGSQPSGIELSRDGATLYVANQGNGSVSAISLDTRTIRSIDVQNALGSAHARDVVEAEPGVLFVVGGSRPIEARDAQDDAIIRVDRNAADEMHRVAADQLLDGTARLHSDRDGRYVLVYTRERLLQLDARDAAAPVLNVHAGRNDEHIEFSPDGTHVLTWDEALDLGTLEPDPDYPLLKGTRSRWSLDGSQLWSRPEFQESEFSVVNARAAVRLGSYVTDCFDDFFFPMSYRSAGGGTWALLQRQTLCLVSTITREQVPGIASDPPPAPPEVPAETQLLALDGFPGGLAVDEARHRAYISLPPQRIVAVDTRTAQIVATFTITAGIPRSLAMSQDGNMLYVGLNSPQGIGYFDLASQTMTRVLNLSNDFPFLEYPYVTTAGANRVIVSAGYGLDGLLDLRPDPGDAYESIAAGIPSAPTVAVGPGGATLYAGTLITDPNQLWRVDLSSAPPVITSADDGFSRTHGRYIAVTPDGQHLHLEHGVVVDSATFRQVGVLGDGLAFPEGNGEKARMAVHLTPVANPEPATLATYDTRTMAIIEVSQTQCRVRESPVLYPAEGGTRWLMLSDAYELCIVTPGN